MLIDLINNPEGSDNWEISQSDGGIFYVTMPMGVKPTPANTSKNKATVKNIIKLKREGFTSEEIAELYEAKVL